MIVNNLQNIISLSCDNFEWYYSELKKKNVFIIKLFPAEIVQCNIHKEMIRQIINSSIIFEKVICGNRQ